MLATQCAQVAQARKARNTRLQHARHGYAATCAAWGAAMVTVCIMLLPLLLQLLDRHRGASCQSGLALDHSMHRVRGMLLPLLLALPA